jgi:hypothetical protein
MSLTGLCVAVQQHKGLKLRYQGPHCDCLGANMLLQHAHCIIHDSIDCSILFESVISFVTGLCSFDTGRVQCGCGGFVLIPSTNVVKHC